MGDHWLFVFDWKEVEGKVRGGKLLVKHSYSDRYDGPIMQNGVI